MNRIFISSRYIICQHRKHKLFFFSAILFFKKTSYFKPWNNGVLFQYNTRLKFNILRKLYIVIQDNNYLIKYILITCIILNYHRIIRCWEIIIKCYLVWTKKKYLKYNINYRKNFSERLDKITALVKHSIVF